MRTLSDTALPAEEEQTLTRVLEAHRLTADLEDELRAALPNLHPILHIEPYKDEAQQRERHRAES